jgi:hypothetical protein
MESAAGTPPLSHLSREHSGVYGINTQYYDLWHGVFRATAQVGVFPSQDGVDCSHNSVLAGVFTLGVSRCNRASER